MKPLSLQNLMTLNFCLILQVLGNCFLLCFLDFFPYVSSLTSWSGREIAREMSRSLFYSFPLSGLLTLNSGCLVQLNCGTFQNLRLLASSFVCIKKKKISQGKNGGKYLADLKFYPFFRDLAL